MVRRAILMALGALLDREAGRLVLGAPEAHADLLPQAITAAEGVGGEPVAAALERLLATAPPQPGLRSAAIRALGRLRWAAAPLLVPCPRSDDPEIRQAASEALLRIGGEPGREFGSIPATAWPEGDLSLTYIPTGIVFRHQTLSGISGRLQTQT